MRLTKKRPPSAPLVVRVGLVLIYKDNKAIESVNSFWYHFGIAAFLHPTRRINNITYKIAPARRCLLPALPAPQAQSVQRGYIRLDLKFMGMTVILMLIPHFSNYSICLHSFRCSGMVANNFTEYGHTGIPAPGINYKFLSPL